VSAEDERPGAREAEADAYVLAEAAGDPLGGLAAGPPQYLTRELLHWATNALQAVMVTPECQGDVRAHRSLRDALLQLDELYTPIFHREALDHG
jgi:hypothetical protein